MSKSPAIRITRLPAFSDNYLWLLDDGVHAAVVDPGDAQPVIDALATLGVELKTILLTHHHPDHTGGVDTLLRNSDATVIGPDSPHIPQVQRKVAEGDIVELLGLELQVIEVPGHTLDHIAYYHSPSAASEQQPLLFCGDTLFAGGCGRVFEGTMPQMHASLGKLAALPAATLVHCAHEYTTANLRFAAAVEPGSNALQQRIDEVSVKRASDTPTVPSRLAEEHATNPFLRCDVDTVIAAARQRDSSTAGDPAGVFATLRQWKDNF